MNKKEFNIIMSSWRDFFTSRGVERNFTDLYLDYIEVLIKQDLPPIFDFHHLCKLLGLKYDFVASIVNGPEKFYHSFEIPKRSGGKREITAPYPSLKFIQRWIYENILSKVKIHGCAHGFVNKRSILTNAKVHQNKKCLLKIDLKDFFPSIPKEWVIQVFKSLGYEHQVSFYLAALCCYEDALPQGSPASPVISNIIARHLDRRLYRVAKKFNLNYSRYADDIAFSGDEINTKFVEYISAIIADCGLKINPSKIRLYKGRGSKILTGISLATGEPRLPRNYRRELEKELFFIDKYGLNGHMSHNKIRKPYYLESILGKVGYWLMIEPNNAFAVKMQKKLHAEYNKKINNPEQMQD